MDSKQSFKRASGSNQWLQSVFQLKTIPISIYFLLKKIFPQSVFIIWLPPLPDFYALTNLSAISLLHNHKLVPLTTHVSLIRHCALFSKDINSPNLTPIF